MVVASVPIQNIVSWVRRMAKQAQLFIERNRIVFTKDLLKVMCEELNLEGTAHLTKSITSGVAWDGSL